LSLDTSTDLDRRNRWLAAALFAMVVAAYLPALNCGFIWDDDDYITENSTLRSADGLRRIWFEPRSIPQYYPVVHTTFWIEYHLWGLEPAGYHLVNVLLHAGNCVLVWFVLRKLGVPGAWLAAAVFGLHPVHVESVAWVTERKNVLSALFYLSSLRLYLDVAGLPATPATESRRLWLRYGLAMALFVAALLSKSVTCSLPAVLILLMVWQRGRIGWPDVRRLVPWFAIGLGMAWHTIALEKTHVGASGSQFAWSFLERILIASRALCFYVGKLVWPDPLTFMYPRWEIRTGDLWQWVFVGLALAVPAACLVMRPSWGRGPIIACLFFAGTLFPALGFINVYPMRYSFVADHFQYLASLGPIVLAAAIAARPRQQRLASWGIAAVVLGVLGFLTWNQQGNYKNPESLWTDVLVHNPKSSAAHFHLGKVLTTQGRNREATQHFLAALELQTDETETQIISTKLANSFLREGRVTDAEAAFEQALKHDPNYWEALNGLANLLARRGDVDQAIPLYRQALAFAPQQAAIHLNLANALAVAGDLAASERAYRAAINLEPKSGVVHLNLGNLLARQRRFAEAEQEYLAALRLDPSLDAAQRNLARVRAEQQQ
jgi:Tfp pilus assembly protein PilF